MNGIDYRTWDPAHDPDYPEDLQRSEACRQGRLQEGASETDPLPGTDDPLIGMVTRLADQKGLDILTEALPEIMSFGVQLVILGTGDEKYHQLLTDATDRYPRRMRVLLQYDDALAKNIYAGCDLFLMPSRYEPCGLGQMIALRYGTVPVVRKTGGLTRHGRELQPENRTRDRFPVRRILLIGTHRLPATRARSVQSTKRRGNASCKTA